MCAVLMLPIALAVISDCYFFFFGVMCRLNRNILKVCRLTSMSILLPALLLPRNRTAEPHL